MKFIYWIIRLFRQKNKGFFSHKESKKIRKQKNKGFFSHKESKKIRKEGDHYFDSIGQLGAKFGKFEIIKPDYNWRPEAEKITKEIQVINGVETMFCTVYNTENCLQILQQAKYGFYEEYDELYNAKLAGVSPYRGGSPHAVAESIRKNGMIKLRPELRKNIRSKQDLIIDITPDMLEEGKKWLDKWEFGHEWIWNPTPQRLIDCLKTSPLGIGVFAWTKNSKGIYYQPAWATPNHWTGLIVAAKPNEYWEVYDSYNEVFKKLDWNYPFKFCKRYYLSKKNPDSVSEGKKLYIKLKGKHIITPDSNGEIYYVGENLKYVPWWTPDEWLQNKLNFGLRDAERKKEFIGVSNEDFEKLKNAVILAGGKVINEEIKGRIEELKSNY